ncbi:MAG: hypothetical protein DRP42_05990 [Tenericutes bacterium]|nr:MAG: hypothetical protein DRP42_05990 [Mycoplasmatota bacterium]
MTEQELLMGVLTKSFNKTEDELAEIMYDKGEDDKLVMKEDALEALLAIDETRIKRIREDVSGDATKKFDDGYKKAQKEVLTKFEKDLKTKFGIESDKSGLELVAEWGESLNKGDGTITLEKIKTHPEFLKLEKEWNETHKEELGTLKTEFDEFKGGVERNKVMSKVRGMAEQEFLKLNPVLSDDAAKAKRQTELFLNKFDSFNYEFQDDGSVVIKDGDKRLEDSHGNRIGFGSFVKTEADKLYDFTVQEKKEGAGNETGGGTGASKAMLSREEYNRKVNAATSDEELVEIYDNYSYKTE